MIFTRDGAGWTHESEPDEKIKALMELARMIMREAPAPAETGEEGDD